MASLITVRLNKLDSPSWGFRLQGGKDFGTPLVVQKVNGGSPAEKAGLIAGDSVIKINNVDVFNLRHKDAQDVVVRSGANFDMTVQRGGSTWKPSVTPTGSIPTPSPVINNYSPVTKTSLSHTKQENIGAIGTGHNVSAKPFNAVNGAVNGGPKLINKQYNTPLKLYSDQSIAETLSAQSEVLSTGALGVNFKKNEKEYDASKSSVLRYVQEADKEPRAEPEPDSGIVTTPNLGTAGLRHVVAPETKPPSSNPQLPPGQNICADCERLIVGVFVRIKDKNLHVECFKCATCGSSLKNVGYYNINNKLYCDIHAKLAARNNPPAPNLVPVAVSPGGRAPINAISAALASHSLPSPSPQSPKQFNNYGTQYQNEDDKKGIETSTPKAISLNVTNEANINKFNNSSLNPATPVSFSNFLNKGNNTAGPRAFSSVSAPLSPRSSTLPRAAPLSPNVIAPSIPSYSPVSSAGRSVNIVWPPPTEEDAFPTACPLYFPPPSQVELEQRIKHIDEDIQELEQIHYMAQFQEPKLSLCSEEVTLITGRKSSTECIETISDSLETQKLVENILKTRPQSPPPIETDIKVSERKEIKSEQQMSAQNIERRKSCDLKRPTEFSPNTIEQVRKPSIPKIENTIPQKWESPLVQALTTASDSPYVNNDSFSQIPAKRSTGALASALSTAPVEPFTPLPPINLQPVPLPPYTEPYLPPEHTYTIEPKEPKPQKPDSKFVKALKVAPETPFTPSGGPTPIKKKKDPSEVYMKDLPKPHEKLSMLSALTTAPDRSYSPLIIETTETSESKSEEQKETKQTKTIERQTLHRPLKPASLPESFKPIVEETPRPPSYPPIFQGFSCSFHNKTDHSEFSVDVCTTPPVSYSEKSQTPHSQITDISNIGAEQTVIETETITEESKSLEQKSKQDKQVIKGKIEQQQPKIEKQAETVVFKKPLPLAQSLHKPDYLPQYQVNLSEEVEADLLMMQKIQQAQERHEQQKLVQKETEKPHITLTEVPKHNVVPIPNIQAESSARLTTQDQFRPVSEARPPSSTFSPRPRSLTPSMINKPPPVLPYYQANLVAHQCSAPTVNLLDPTSPAISRSPSPCPERREGRSRSPSPFPAKERPVSPAPGPPPNPLQSNRPLPTPQDSKRDEAKRNLSAYIPQYKEKRDLIEEVQGMDFLSQREHSDGPTQMYTSQVQTQNIPANYYQDVHQTQLSQTLSSGISMQNKQTQNLSYQQKTQELQNLQVQDSQRAQLQTSQEGGRYVTTAVSEKAHQEYLEEQKKSESKSIEQSRVGNMQIQRKKTVTEEFEHTHKETNIEIAKSVSSTSIKKHPFHDKVNPPVDDKPAVVGLHVTNPQPIISTFLGNKPQATTQICPQSGKPCQLAGTCQGNITMSQQPYSCQQTTPCIPTPTVFSKPETPLPVTQSQIPNVPVTPKQPPVKHVTAPACVSSASKNQNVKPSVPLPNTGTGGGRQTGAIGVAPKRGRGIINVASIGGARVPLCGQCHSQIRGPFITALGKIWCPDHFVCATPSCRRPLQDMGFVEEQGQLFCEYCFEQYLAPQCSKCNGKIKGDCLKAIGKKFHPECFNCVYCGKLFGCSPFFLEDGSPYCDKDWNELFTTKCYACGFPVEAGDRWVEALNNNYHSQCFNCTMCKKNLEGQSFFAKGGRPYCKTHAR